MKKLSAVTLVLLASVLSLPAQVQFAGTAEIGFSASIPESADFTSLLNPGNMMGLRDFSINSSLIARLDAGDDKTTFSAWLALKEYPIGQALLAGTYDPVEDPAINGAEQLLTGEFIALAGDTILSFDLMRFSANVYLGDYVSLEAGRQSMLTGYGYGWNPIDFANPLKDPADPDAALRGVDALSLKIDMGYAASLKLYGIVPDEILLSGIDFEEIKGGGELTLYLPGFELKLAGIYDYDKTAGSDAYAPSVGAGFMADIFGLGFYGEAAVRKGSRNLFADGTSAPPVRKDDWLFSVLAGLEYTFPNELYAVAEYFYNGEGLDKDERALFESSVQASAGALSSQIFGIYSPGYFARHYLMINLLQPLYDINTDISLAVIFSPDSGALTVLPSLSYGFSGNFTGRLEYTGMFDLYDNDFSEVSAQPVRHMMQVLFTYSL